MATGLVITHLSLHLPWRSNNYLLSSLSRRSFSTNYTRWDSNAEAVRSRRFGFDFKRRDQNDDDDDEESDEEYENDDDVLFKSRRKKRRWWSDEFDDGGIIEEVIDSIWIFKVFKAYGWFFPFILSSLLLMNGPKAFVMALALPVGQSLISFAFDKLWRGTKARTKRGPWTRRKQSARATSSTKIEEEEEEEEEEVVVVEEEILEPSKGKKTGYQSWVVENGKSGRNGASFGGWDDLERTKRDNTMEKSKSKSKSKLSRRERKSDTPLLLRLLVAVFPFLGSWTKMFW